jgi:hypothetical protein
MVADFSLLDRRWSNRLQGRKILPATEAEGFDRPNNLLRVGGELSSISWGIASSTELRGGRGLPVSARHAALDLVSQDDFAR